MILETITPLTLYTLELVFTLTFFYIVTAGASALIPVTDKSLETVRKTFVAVVMLGYLILCLSGASALNTSDLLNFVSSIGLPGFSNGSFTDLLLNGSLSDLISYTLTNLLLNNASSHALAAALGALSRHGIKEIARRVQDRNKRLGDEAKVFIEDALNLIVHSEFLLGSFLWFKLYYLAFFPFAVTFKGSP